MLKKHEGVSLGVGSLNNNKKQLSVFWKALLNLSSRILARRGPGPGACSLNRQQHGRRIGRARWPSWRCQALSYARFWGWEMLSVLREFTVAAGKGVGGGEAGVAPDRCAVCNVRKKRSSRGRLIDAGG